MDGMLTRLGDQVEEVVKTNYPNLVALKESVENIPQIKEHLKNRPKTPF